MTASSAFTPHETEILRVLGEIVAALKSADSGGEADDGGATLAAIAAVAGAQTDPDIGNEAMFAFVQLTDANFSEVVIDALREKLNTDPVDPSVLAALRREKSQVTDAAHESHVQAAALVARPEVPSPPPTAIPLGDAASVLSGMLDERGVSGETRDPHAVWRVFVEFAKRPVAATPPLFVDPDMCLFEGFCRTDEGRLKVTWNIVRQFSLNTADGEYDHMEQLHLTIVFIARPETTHGASGPLGGLWSGAVIDDWATHVEALDVLGIPADTTTTPTIQIRHENV